MTDVNPFECPICMLHYAEEEPTTFPCGHSCCLSDAKQMKKCHICRKEIPSPTKMVPNYTLRDAAKFDQAREKERTLKAETDAKIASEAKLDDILDSVDLLSISNKKPSKKKPNKKNKNSSSMADESAAAELSVPNVVTDDRHLEKLLGEEEDEDDEEEVNSSNASSAADTRVNIDALQPYVIRMYPNTDPSDKEMTTNLEKIFRLSVPLGEMFQHWGLNGDTSGNSPWNVIVYNICGIYARKKVTRFIVQNEEKSHAVLFDILAVKVCPHHLVGKTMLKYKKDEKLKAEDVDVYPLILVRYNYSTKEMISRDGRNSGVIQEIQDGVNRQVTVFTVETSTEVVQKAWTYLRAKQALIAPEYARKFASENKALFSPSILVPTMESLVTKPKEGPCSVAGCNKVGWAICGKCKSAQYCSREHQVEHWKVHKKVCGKSHTELSSVPAVSASSTSSTAPNSVDEGPSVVVSLSMGPDYGLGPNGVKMAINWQTGKADVHKIHDTARNVHGDGKFLVKVQLGISWMPVIRANRDTAMMIYDEARSIQAQVDKAQEPQFSAVFDAVHSKGVAIPEKTGTNERLKGYLYAKREGNNLRLFINQFVPLQNW